MIKSWLLGCLLICLSYQAIAEVSFDIEGLKEQDAIANVSVFLKGLAIPENANNDSYLLEVENSTKQSLIALGYYQAQTVITVSDDDETDQTVTININPGIRTKIITVNLTLTGEALNNSAFKKLLLNFPIKQGQFLNHGDYESAKGLFSNLAQRLGYFDARYKTSVVDVTLATNSAVVNLWFDSGIRYQFGKLLFDNELPVDKFVRSLANFQQGDPFNTSTLNQFNVDLNETGYFRSITILPEISNKEGREIPLDVIASMRPEDSFNAGFGYSTDEGIRGKFRWVRPWVNDAGHSIEANVIASLPKQEASLTYKIPITDPLYNYVSIQTGYKTRDQNDTDTEQYIVGLNRHWRLDNKWLRTLYVRYDKESGEQGQQTFDTELILPGFSFSRLRTRGGINIDWGDKQLMYFEFANKNLFSSDDVIKVYGQSKLIRTYAGHQFVFSVELGAIFSHSIYDVPSSMRFFTGGDQSIRGYGYEDIAPRDSQDYLVGGSYLAVGSLEYRFPVTKNWKIAVFSDVGTATDSFSEPLSISTGGGLVWSSPVGPIRLYLAFPLSDSESSFKIHFMIGPEL